MQESRGDVYEGVIFPVVFPKFVGSEWLRGQCIPFSMVLEPQDMSEERGKDPRSSQNPEKREMVGLGKDDLRVLAGMNRHADES